MRPYMNTRRRIISTTSISKKLVNWWVLEGMCGVRVEEAARWFQHLDRLLRGDRPIAIVWLRPVMVCTVR